MRKFSEEEVFILSALACSFPFIYVIVSFFETAEPYNYLVFCVALMEGSFVGSVFGVIALVCNRSIKSIKIYILSLVPVLMLLISIIGDFIYSYNKP